MNKRKKEVLYSGIPVSEGVVTGIVYKLDSGAKPPEERSIKKSEVSEEILRFQDALVQTRKELLEIQHKIAQAMGNDHANIFNAHLLVVEDLTILEEVTKRIETERKNAEFIFSEVMERFVKVFNDIEDEYLRERVYDIEDVTSRILRNLRGEKKEDLSNLTGEVIVVAYDLSPSETAMMHKENVIGFATDIGGKTSHTAIMARSLGIPAVVGLHDVSPEILSGSKVILDGNKGLLIVNPKKETLRRYSDKKTVIKNYEQKLGRLKDLDAVTPDGFKMELQGNIEMPEDVMTVLQNGARGVGLYRTEFCYMNRSDLPSEEELTSVYRQVVEGLKDHPVIIRTMDMGGDKFLCHLKLPEEMNPFLGWRAIRFCLEREDLFKTQLRAILRASAFGKTKIMYPMISNVTEVIQANRILKKCMRELKKENVRFDEHLEIGAMIEIPSAGITADLIADHVDFFSIGTNDLIQYTLAVDRINEKIAYLYQPFHPAILRIIENVVEVGRQKKISVSVCGEMAGDPAGAVILMGLGINTLSLSPNAIPKIKSVIRSVSFSESRDLIEKAKKCTTAGEIKSLVDAVVKRVLPNFMEL
jgi:phosphotransferase system enzyme I (PtsI)